MLHFIGLVDAAAQSGVSVTNPLAGCSAECRWAPGNALDYELWATSTGQNLEMDTLHINAILAAAEAWRFGSNQRLRGASWRFVSVSPDGSWSLTNLDNEVILLDDVVFDDVFNNDGDPDNDTQGVMQPSFYPAAQPAPLSCARKGFDLVIREHPVLRGASTWANVRQTRESRASDTTPAHLDASLEATLLHEFGHVFGFGHLADVSSVMGGYGPAVAGGRLSISEYEYNQVTMLKPHTSTGNNLTLSKVMPTIAPDGVLFRAERWDAALDVDVYENQLDNPGNSICKQLGPRDPSTVLEEIHLLHLGTAALNDVVVRWRVYPPGGQCTGAGSYLLGARTVGSLASNTPYPILPAGQISGAGIPAGSYRVCAFVDPDGVITETDESDNKIDSEANLIVTETCGQ